jgi:hypothetical protein
MTVRRIGPIVMQMRDEAEDGGWRRLPGRGVRVRGLDRSFARALSREMRLLELVDRSRVDGMIGDAITNRLSGYDFASHKRAVDITLARATRTSGWDGRGLFMDRANSGYWTFRRIRFRTTCLRLLQASVTGLSGICADTRLFGKDAFSVSLPEVPRWEEWAKMEEEFLSGSVGIDMANERLLNRSANG